jgi:hypothetical protein
MIKVMNLVAILIAPFAASADLAGSTRLVVTLVCAGAIAWAVMLSKRGSIVERAPVAVTAVEEPVA